MPEIRGNSDDSLEAIAEALGTYEDDHPKATVTLYRQNAASIRVRIIDPDFAGIDIGTRHNQAWALVDHLPEEVQSEISILLLVTPKETKNSIANMEFENPVPSHL